MNLKNYSKEELIEIIQKFPITTIFSSDVNTFLSLFSGAQIGISLTNEKGKINANDTFYKIIGHTKEDMERVTWMDITHPDDVENDKKILNAYINNEIDTVTWEKRYLRKNGDITWVNITTTKLHLENNYSFISLTIIQDITEKKQAFEALKKSHEEYRILFDNNPLPCAIFETETLQFLAVNDAFEEHYGYTEEEITQQTILYIRPKEEIEKTKKSITPTDTGVVNVGEFVHQKKNGDIIIVEIYRHDIEFRGKDAKIVVINDVTKRKQAEKSHLEAQRFKAMGEMAASIAHDFNNSLQTIVGNLTAMRSELGNDAQVLNRMESIEDIIGKVASRVSGIQKLGSANNFKPNEVLNPNTTIQELLNQVLSGIQGEANRKGIEINILTNFNSLGNIVFSKPEFCSVIHNLIKNGIEAMPNGGNIVITTETLNNQISICVEDSGVGMSDEVKAKIFEPYFTTKGFDLGRGLGMSGAYSLVNTYNGSISVQKSEVGIGTIFEILLPLTEENITPFSDRQVAPKELNKELKVLWVEDEFLISATSQLMVEQMGHICDAALDAESALKLLEKNTYDIVISDLGMAGMNGLQLAKVIREKYGKELPVVIISGWKMTDTEMEENGVNASLIKPFYKIDLEELFWSLFAQ